MLRDLDDGKLKEWATTPAPLIAKNYWKLKGIDYFLILSFFFFPSSSSSCWNLQFHSILSFLLDDAMMKDVFLAIRADEANHRDVNHVLSKLKITDPNPFAHVLEEKPATK